MAEGADVTVHVEPEPVVVTTEPANDNADLALLVGRIDGSLSALVERLSNVETRQEQLWNNEQARLATPPIVVEQPPETETTPDEEVLVLEEQSEGDEPSETESEPGDSPKHQHKTIWDHL